MKDNPMMGCGHAANAVTRRHKGIEYPDPIPCCVICAGISPGAYTIVETPDLSKREARCHYRDCLRISTSDPNRLAFFEYRPYEKYDKYYCGCKGWD